VKLTCKKTVELATERAEGALDAATRVAFDAHLEGCDGCRSYVRQLELTRQVLGRIPAPEVSPALEQAVMAGFDAWVKASAAPATPRAEPRPVRRFSRWGAIAIAGLGVAVLLVTFANQRSRSPKDWIIAGGLAVAALAVSSVAGRLATGMVVAAVGAAIAAALVGGGEGTLAATLGAECLVTELVMAGMGATAAWVAVRRESRAVMRGALSAGAIAGALAADAALQIACPAHEALAHLLVFHLGGVVLVAAGAWALLRPGRATAGV
jgi:hypothetical protein